MTPFAAAADGLDEARVKELVLETIRQNPEIIMEAVAILEQRQANIQESEQSEVLKNQRILLERDPNAPVLGNPDGDVTVVRFFDYNCPYCRRVVKPMQGLLDGDSNVRLVPHSKRESAALVFIFFNVGSGNHAGRRARKLLICFVLG